MTAVTELADEFVEALFAADPLTPALMGIRPAEPGLPDQSAEAERAFRARLAEFAERARAIPAEGLSAEDRVTREVLISTAENRIASADSRMAEFTVTDLSIGPAAGLLLALPMTTVTAGETAEAQLGRLAAIPEFLRQSARRHAEGIADGLVPVAHLVDAAVAHLDRYLAEPANDPLRRQPAPDEEFERRREELLADVVRPAFAEYRAFLADEVKPHGRPEDRPGLSWLPGGEETYARLARLHTTTQHTPEELHRIGLDVIDSLAAEYRELGQKVFGTDDLAEIFERLRTDPALRWGSADDLLDTARTAVARAAAEAPKWFGRIPEQQCTVEAVPAEVAPGAPAAYYLRPAADGSRPGIYFANTHQATERLRHMAETTAFHEAVPGHHFQLTIAQGLTELPLLRRIGGFSAYIEGWGLYSERLAEEMGLYSDDIARLGMLAGDSLRAGRLVVDTGLHALGWSRQQAIDYLLEHTPEALPEIESEVDRYIAWPGQALAYMVGRLEIQRNRARAGERLGSRFDVRAFHDLVLAGGPLPLSVLASVVDEWVAGHGDTVDGLAGELVELTFEQEPLTPSVLGLPGDHDRLADQTRAAKERFRAAYTGLADRARALPTDGLSPEEAVTREVVIAAAEVEADRLGARSADMAVSDGLTAPALELLMYLPYYKLDDEKKARGYLARLAAVEPFLATLTERQRESLAEGLVPPAYLARVGAEYIDRYLAAPDRDPLKVATTAAVENFEADRDRLLAEVVRPAYARYRDFLRTEVEPVGRPDTAPGISHVPGGAERYAALIRAETTTERTAEELHETGLALIEKLGAEYRELGAKVFGTTELAEIFERLRTDPALRWRDGDELLSAARDAIARAEAVAPRWFSHLPAEKCEVAPVPEADAASGTIAYYLPPALDGTRPGTYYANTHEADKRPRFTSEAIAFHEAVPGHHFQLSLAQELRDLPLLRRIGMFNAYAEGWGLYAERLADEMGLYSDDVSRLGMLTQDSMRAGRLVVDTGLHALGWSRQQAIDFLVEHTPMAQLEIEAEIDRYIAWPGQALGYMVGRLEIQRLRADAEAALGERFDIRGFHEVVLGHGMLPMSALAKVVTDWVAGQCDTPGRLADDLVALNFERQPLYPSVFGLPGEHDKLPDPGAEDRFRAGYSAIAARAEALDPAGLPAAERVTREVVISQARTEIDEIDSRRGDIAVSDGLGAPALQLLLFLPQTVLDDEVKVRGYLSRLAGVGGYLDAVITRQRAALGEGLVPPEFLVRIGIGYVERYLAAPESDPLRVTPAYALEGFEAERDRLLAEVVHPAYERYRAFLADEVAPVARPETSPGIGDLPGGPERYAALIRVETTTDRTARELHETGLALIEKLGAEYRELGAKIFGTTELAEIFDRIRTDPALRWRDGEELLAGARAAITRAEAVAPQWFSRVPEQQCGVAPVPEAEAASGTIAYYLQPSLDGTRPGVYYANTHEAEKRPRFTSEAVAFHEAVPGHHFQLCLAQGLTDLPLLRRIAHVNAYAEGWGLYAERLADEMGLYSDDVSRLGMLTQDSMRAGRLVVDTGLHALGWSRQQAVDYLVEHTPMARLEIEAEIDRYAANPGQALGYMVGRLEIQRLRAEAEAALGDRFDIREFHDVVLGSGTLPLPVLAGVVADWVAGYGDTPDRLADECLELMFEAQPLIPSLYGLPGTHDKLADQTAEAAGRYRAGLAGLIARAEALDAAALAPAERVTRDVVIWQARTEIDLLDSGRADIAVSDGLAAPALMLLVELPQSVLDDEPKARGYLSRLAAIGTYLDQLIERQRAALAEGLVPPEFLARIGIGYVERYLGAPDEDPLKVPVHGLEAERDRLLAEVVRPAYERYRDFLACEVVPVARPETSPGLGDLPGGPERYAALIRAETTTERTAQELHDTGLAIIERLAGEYRELGAKVFGTTELAEIFERIRTDPALRWRDGEELLEAARRTIARAEAVAPQWFLRVPEQRCQVAPVPPAEAESGSIAYYIDPSLDGSRPGTYYANTTEADQRQRTLSEAVAFHEAVPGHHFQLTLAQQVTGVPLLRRICMFNAYVEGWGLYAERLADEMGLYSDDVSRFGLLTQDSMRAARLVVDTGLHALGWSRQRAVDFLRENTPMAQIEIEAEIDRYAGHPGQALSYMVGRLEIERLRAEAEEALGDRFDIREFHDTVLGSGTLPLPVLATVVADWVATRAGEGS
ncbi:DUF885 domain-containing protein [Amycolatopsis sp. SID8362]|uniref:DUF885 domain-containing protein n=1 Tax=Amycolatopsis sp. SID8362 TaxID=2690346 RepID=UPI00136D78DD|nr:DUF885 domain-containing protein [Amycolatopsis sp. SID8362]NBH03421.1 DUF885 family protein [Amycolatopsis sp. SID8362]NED40121.1 DUF885 domain-containing protein [Amycolatopsis sp. SID8362]